jgi:hypothetical protein
MHPLDGVEHRLHHHRREAETRFVEHQQLWLPHKTHRNHEHLQLSTGQIACRVPAHLLQHGEIAEHHLHHFLAALRLQQRCRLQVLRNGHAPEALASVLNQRDAAASDRRRMRSRARDAIHGDVAGGHFATFERQHSGDRFHQRRLAGTVCTQQSDERFLGHGEVNVLQRRYGAVVMDGHAPDVQQRCVVPLDSRLSGHRSTHQPPRTGHS